jgi:hypothetical protein
MAAVVPSVISMFTFFTPPASVPPVAEAIASLPQLASPLLSVPPAAEAIPSLPHLASPLRPAAEAIQPLPRLASPLLSVPPAAELSQPLIFRTSGLSTAVTPYVAPSSLPSIATHAERNPQMTIQKARFHPTQSDPQKSTANLRRLADLEKHDLLATELGEFMERQRIEMEDLASRHATTVEHLNKLLNYTPHYLRKVRGINIENAKIHAKGEEVNAGKIKCPLLCI